MRQLSVLRNGLGLDGDQCMRDIPTGSIVVMMLALIVRGWGSTPR